MPRLPRNLHLVATWRSPANAIRKKTRDTSKVLRLPCKMTMDTSKVRASGHCLSPGLCPDAFFGGERGAAGQWETGSSSSSSSSSSKPHGLHFGLPNLRFANAVPHTVRHTFRRTNVFDISSAAFALPPPRHERVLRMWWGFFVVDFLARSGTATAPGMSPCLRPSTVITNYCFPEQMHRSHRAMIRFVRFFSLNCRFETAVADTAKEFLVPKSKFLILRPLRLNSEFSLEFLRRCRGQHDFPTALPGPNGINAVLNYRYIQTCFVTCWKSFCVVGAILLRRFQKMRGSFRGTQQQLQLCALPGFFLPFQKWSSLHGLAQNKPNGSPKFVPAQVCKRGKHVAPAT